jgi:hypothetical protein
MATKRHHRHSWAAVLLGLAVSLVLLGVSASPAEAIRYPDGSITEVRVRCDGAYGGALTATSTTNRLSGSAYYALTPSSSQRFNSMPCFHFRRVEGSSAPL